MSDLYHWAARHGVSTQALNELIAMSIPNTPVVEGTEGAVQQKIRLHSANLGHRLWRNNTGALKDETGRLVRYGLGNDSARINKYFKPPDLIGITSILITPAHVGRVVGLFTGVEAKPGGWTWSGTDREQAQLKFLNVVTAAGGLATFATSNQDYEQCIINAIV